MANNNINNHCLICGKGYHVCHSCRDIKQFSPWRTVVDTINCFQIYTTLSEYNAGLIDTDKAREQLQRCDLSGKNSFKERPRNTIDTIMGESKKVSRRATKQPVVEVVEATDTEEVKEAEVADSADTEICE